jgi:hypothetical protein
VVTAAVGACAVALALLLAPRPGLPTLLALTACAVVVALDLRVDGPRVPSVLGAVVAGSFLLAPGAPYAAGVVVVVVATTSACLLGAGRPVWWAPVLAATAAVGAATAFDVSPTRTGALLGGLVFQLVVVTRPARLVWLSPVACSAVGLAGAGRVVGGAAGVLAWGGALVLVAGSVTAWGAPPWASRYLAHRRAWPRFGCRASVMLTTAISATCGVVAAPIAAERAIWVASASALAAAATTMVAVGVRQWRFVPRRRRRDAAVLVLAAVTVVVAYPSAATAGSPWSIALLGAVVVVVGAVGWPLACRIDRGAGGRAGQRIPERRSASA